MYQLFELFLYSIMKLKLPQISLFLLIFLLAFAFKAYKAESVNIPDIEKVEKGTHLNLVDAFRSPFNVIDGAELNKLSNYLNGRAESLRFNGEVLIAKNDQVIYQEAFGYKNPIDKVELKKDLSFELASVSKQFTAAAILKLQEEGKLSIQDPVSKYLPAFNFEQITITDLLKHRSGLWDYMFLTERYWDEDTAPDNQDVVCLIAEHENRLSFTPGRRFDYNNTNYALLAAIVEAQTNLSFKDYLERTFFEPLCMSNTYVGLAARKHDQVVNAFQPYRYTFLPLPPSFHNAALGDKGINASAKDLFTWFKALKNGEILSKESTDMMFNISNRSGNKYGMGFRTKFKKGKLTRIYHNGLWDGYRNGLVYLPDEDLTIIVLSHTQNRRKFYMQKQALRKAKSILQEAVLQ